MPMLEDKDLIQVDATAIAGVLILLTLTSIGPEVPRFVRYYDFSDLTTIHISLKM
jgi:hypothetical protein